MVAYRYDTRWEKSEFNITERNAMTFLARKKPKIENCLPDGQHLKAIDSIYLYCHRHLRAVLILIVAKEIRLVFKLKPSKATAVAGAVAVCPSSCHLSKTL